jgi:hypothetical protein
MDELKLKEIQNEVLKRSLSKDGLFKFINPTYYLRKFQLDRTDFKKDNRILLVDLKRNHPMVIAKDNEIAQYEPVSDFGVVYLTFNSFFKLNIYSKKTKKILQKQSLELSPISSFFGLKLKVSPDCNYIVLLKEPNCLKAFKINQSGFLEKFDVLDNSENGEVLLNFEFCQKIGDIWIITVLYGDYSEGGFILRTILLYDRGFEEVKELKKIPLEDVGGCRLFRFDHGLYFVGNQTKNLRKICYSYTK